MCVVIDRKVRRLRGMANVALVTGLLLWIFARQANGHARIWLDAVIGLQMGFSIGMNLTLVIQKRRGRTATL